MVQYFDMYAGWGTMALRLVIAAVFLVHGWPKIKNPAGIAQAAWGGVKALGLLHGVVEVAGAVALVTGFYMREAALLLALIMVGAIYFKIAKWKLPFMAEQSTGWEFDLVLLGGLLAILLG